MKFINKVIKGVIDYPNLYEPKAFGENEDKTFSCVLIIDKNDTKELNKYYSTFEELKNDQAKQTEKFRPLNFKSILRDGDVERPDEKAYQNKFFINLKKKAKKETDKIPVLKRNDGEYVPIHEEEQAIYAGCRVAIEITFFNYDSNGSYGVSAILKQVMKIQDGERIRATEHTNASVFDDVEIEETSNEEIESPF